MTKERPSIGKIIIGLGLSGPLAQKLRDETRSFLMAQHSNDNEKVTRLGKSAVLKHANDFLLLRGQYFFPSTGSGVLTWPKDCDKLVNSIQRIMFQQKLHKYYHMKGRGILRTDETLPTSDSESDVAARQSSRKKRLATEGAELWSPGGAQGDSPARRSYVTRSAHQPGMPLVYSVEDPYTNITHAYPGQKRQCKETPSSEARWRGSKEVDEDSSPLSSRQLASMKRIATTADIPIRRRQSTLSESAGQRENHEYEQLQNKCSASQQRTRSANMSANKKKRNISLTGIPMVDEFLLEQAEDQSILANEHTPSNTNFHLPYCGLTPPPSSSDDNSVNRSLFPQTLPTQHCFGSEIHAENLAVKNEILLPLSNETCGVVDLTRPDLVEIQTGDDTFRVISKESAPRVLQKLIDIFVDELRICRRNLRRSPAVQQKRIWQVQSEQLEKLLMVVENDNGLWQGGSFD